MNPAPPYEPHPLSTLASYEGVPDLIYSLDRVAELLDLPRRWIALCARHGLIEPVSDPSAEGLHFDAAALQTLRHIEFLRARHRLDLPALKLLLDLAREVEELRAEIRFLRSS